MKIELKKMTKDIGHKEYLMYQEIPKEEYGAINEAYGLSEEEFKSFVEDTINEEFALFTMYETPRITYILYIDDYPVGEIKLRPILNQHWYDMSGNIGYKIRPSERGKGYGNIILQEMIKECHNYPIENVYIQCKKENIKSKKIIEKNGGQLIEEYQDILRYKIIL